MIGAHLASPIRGELGWTIGSTTGYADWPQLGTQIWGSLGQVDVRPNYISSYIVQREVDEERQPWGSLGYEVCHFMFLASAYEGGRPILSLITGS